MFVFSYQIITYVQIPIELIRYSVPFEYIHCFVFFLSFFHILEMLKMIQSEKLVCFTFYACNIGQPKAISVFPFAHTGVCRM